MDMSAITAAVAPTPGLEEKLHDLNGILRSMGRVLIGYSGGVDSAMLALAAHKVLGANAIAVTADSASYASGELEAAAAITEQFGINVAGCTESDDTDSDVGFSAFLKQLTVSSGFFRVSSVCKENNMPGAGLGI